MKLKCRIADVRYHKRISQARLSEMSDVAITMISAYENEKRYPNTYTLWRLAIALECKVDELYEVITD